MTNKCQDSEPEVEGDIGDNIYLPTEEYFSGGLCEIIEIETPIHGRKTFRVMERLDVWYGWKAYLSKRNQERWKEKYKSRRGKKVPEWDSPLICQ